MIFEQKFQAIQALFGFAGDVNIRMREPGNWYVSTSLEKAENGCLSGGLVSAKTPELAVHQYWDWVSIGVIRVNSQKRVTWNGFMWADARPE